MPRLSWSSVSRRAFIAATGLGLAGIGAGALSLNRLVVSGAGDTPRPWRLYLLDHLSNRVVMESGDGAAPPAVAVIGELDELSGYASRFVYRKGEPIELYFPAPGDACSSHRDDGCVYGDRVALPSDGLQPGLYRCRYFVDDTAHEVMFSVVDPDRLPPVCLVYPSSTYQAYNKAGGENLYSVGTLETFHVSMLRPLGSPTWFHDPRHNHAHTLLASNHVDFFAIDSAELDAGSPMLDEVRLFVLAQHDEYWSWNMRDRIERHLRRGRPLLCLSGNVMFWKVRFENDNVAVQKISPTPSAGELETWTGKWSRILSEERTMGLAWRYGGYPVKREFETFADFQKNVVKGSLTHEAFERSDGIEVMAPEHPLFAGTGLGRHDVFGDEVELLSVEVDGAPIDQDNAVDRTRAPHAPPEMNILARAWSSKAHRIRSFGTLADFRFEGRGRVINVGTIGWVKAALHDDTVARVTSNAFSLLLDEPSSDS